MRDLLILEIVTTALEEIAIVLAAFWLLPKFGINLPLAAVVALMVIWAAHSVFTFWLGSKALRRKSLPGWHNMVGSQGVVVNPLSPQGLVKIKGELWAARSDSDGDKVAVGKQVVVVEQDGLKLVVRVKEPE